MIAVLVLFHCSPRMHTAPPHPMASTGASRVSLYHVPATRGSVDHSDHWYYIFSFSILSRCYSHYFSFHQTDIPKPPLAMSQHLYDSENWPLPHARSQSVLSSSTRSSRSSSLLAPPLSPGTSSQGSRKTSYSSSLYDEVVRLPLNPCVTVYVWAPGMGRKTWLIYCFLTALFCGITNYFVYRIPISIFAKIAVER